MVIDGLMVGRELVVVVVRIVGIRVMVGASDAASPAAAESFAQRYFDFGIGAAAAMRVEK